MVHIYILYSKTPVLRKIQGISFYLWIMNETQKQLMIDIIMVVLDKQKLLGYIQGSPDDIKKSAQNIVEVIESSINRMIDTRELVSTGNLILEILRSGELSKETELLLNERKTDIMKRLSNMS